jgi:hypothetical protein
MQQIQIDPGQMQQGAFRESTVMWTALPQGTFERGGQKFAKVAAFVSIRLRSQTTSILSAFPEFLDWPAVLEGMDWAVDFGGGQLVKGHVMHKPSSQLWKELFKGSTLLRSFEFDDYSARNIRSYPVRWVAGFIRTQYAGLAAASPSDLPSVSSLADPGMFGALHFKRGEEEELRKRIDQHMARKKAVSIAQLGPITSPEAHKQAFLQAKVFHEPKTFTPVPLPKYPVDKQKFEEMVDFHQMLAALANFPEMLRRLGLMVELEMDASEVPNSVPNLPHRLQLASHQFKARDRHPFTAFVFDGRRFLPASRPGAGDYQWGMLQLQDQDAYEVTHFDVDGAAIKLLNFVHDLAKAQVNKSQDTPKEQGAPSLRSGGFSVARVDRGVKTAQGFAGSKELEEKLQKGTTITFFAEDLARGYRVDVWDSRTQRWHSLHWRDGTYKYVDNAQMEHLIKVVEDEGWVQLGATQSPDPNIPAQDKDLFVHESMFNWKGWSLSVGRPGRSIDPDDEVKDIEPVLATHMKLKTSFRPTKNSLPLLRYGRRYRFRSRMVDLGGWGVGQIEADGTCATGEIPYLRFEPVPPPTVLLKALLDMDEQSGESLERLVIRSYNDQESKDKDRTKESTERHVAPPRGSQMDAEQHGMFDDPGGKMMLDPQTYAMIAAKDKGQLKHAPSGDPIEGQDVLQLPYLPDPLAQGASLAGLPGEKTSAPMYQFQGTQHLPVRQLDYGKSTEWPELRAFRVKLVEGDQEPEWNDQERSLTVFLPKAGVARFKLSSFLRPEMLERMGLWQWVEMAKANGKIDDPHYNRLKHLAQNGQHWMITPFRWVELVHAVQQPLGAPEISALYPHRLHGWTHVHLNGAVSVDGKSSIKMEMMARWEERRDDPQDPKNDPVKDRKAGHVRAFEMHLEPQDTAKQFIQDWAMRHDLGDTKYRRIRYRAVTTSRFKEYLPKSVRDDPKSSFARESEQVELEIPSSARPMAPRVAYILPLFGWSKGLVGQSVRKGNALRVYLERPWFSSGDGEKLAVVLCPGKLPASDDELDRIKPYVSMIGQDPLWKSARTPGNLPLASFLNKHESSRLGLPLAELDDGMVDVAAFDVDYDHEKGMWFADIELNAGDSYTPFIRLALARYQPVSVDRAHLSPVILADFAQTVPNRTLTVVKQPQVSRVTVSGLSYSAHAGGEGMPDEIGHSEIEVSLERFEKSIGTDLGWVAEKMGVVTKDPASGAPVLWSGTVALPLPDAQSVQLPPRYRVVVKEYETIAQDAQALEGYHFGSFPLEPGRRLVYVDHLDL